MVIAIALFLASRFPIDVITLLLTFVQTLIAVLTYFEGDEKIMENRNNTVWCGTRGVIKYVCEIYENGNNVTSVLRWVRILSAPPYILDYLHAGSPLFSVTNIVVDFRMTRLT